MTNEHLHRVSYKETDRMGYVYYANYLVHFEIGRTEFMRQGGYTYRELEDAGYYLPVVNANCDYKKPALYDDLLTIRTSVTEFKGIRLAFGYEILRDGEVLAQGTTSHVFVDGDGKPKRLPVEIRERLEVIFGQ
jgi:acyl-CoA thioester hydrolase